jgi:hypothetical protein
MNYIILEFFSKQYALFSLVDGLEIILLSMPLYYFSLWLRKDHKKNLLLPFYGFCVLSLFSVSLHLTTISSFLLWYGPVITMLFILVHQELLQRNFITLHTIKSKNDTAASDWVKPLIQACLRARNNNKNVRILIENQASLASFINTDFFIQAPLQYHLLNTLFESTSYDPEKIVWLNQSGTIIAINCAWSLNAHEAWMSEELKEKDPWLADTLLFTSKTDALACCTSDKTDAFAIIAHGNLIENVYAPDALRIINHYLARSIRKKGEPVHETYHPQKRHYEQPHH